VLQQRGSTFEQRLLDGLARAAVGFDRIVVIGSDIPQLSLDDLRSAVAAKDDTWTIGGAVTVAPTCSVCPAANWISFEVWPGAPVVCTCSCWIACSCCR
jgi:hypothetical protein